MASIQGPALFLAQYMGDAAPFNNLDTITDWCRDLGYIGVQIPTWDPRCIDLEQAATSEQYCQDWKGNLDQKGMSVTELSTHLQGQLVAVHPAYDILFDGFAADEASLPSNVRATHRSLFDGTLQGIERTDRPAFSFQGHPEASPGPRDVAPLFDRFIAMMQARR